MIFYSLFRFSKTTVKNMTLASIFLQQFRNFNVRNCNNCCLYDTETSQRRLVGQIFDDNRALLFYNRIIVLSRHMVETNLSHLNLKLVKFF